MKKWFRSDFDKVHAAVMLFGSVNVLLGITLKFGLLPYSSVIVPHMVAGFSLVPLLLLTPLIFRKRRLLYRALAARLFPSKRDLQPGRAMTVVAKVLTLLMALGFLLQIGSALVLRTGLWNGTQFAVGAYLLHSSMIYALLPLVVLHPIAMKLAQRRPPKAKTPAGTAEA